MTEEKNPFSITFILSDAYGNIITKTMMLQAASPEPSPSQIPTASPEALPEKNPTEDQESLPANQTIEETETAIGQTANVFHMEEETVGCDWKRKKVMDKRES